MEKVIFLDIDGVLNSNFWNENHQREISDGILIEEEKVALLGTLVKRTGAKLVLHSGWRVWFDEDMQPLRKEAERLVEMLHVYGMVLTDVTPDLTTEEIRRTKKFSLVKAQEILAWMEQHPRVGKWIVLDDLDLHDETVARQQVQPDAEVGLTQKDVEKAIFKLEHDCDMEQAKLISRVGMYETYECLMCGCEFSVLGEMALPYEPQPLCRVYVEWSEEVSMKEQIALLRKEFEKLRNYSVGELLKLARQKERLEVGEMSLWEARVLKDDMKKQGIEISVRELT